MVVVEGKWETTFNHQTTGSKPPTRGKLFPGTDANSGSKLFLENRGSMLSCHAMTRIISDWLP